ncbi:MAG: cupin domain-containing protein [Janthinobacterium lividum]
MSNDTVMADADARRALKDDLLRMNCRVHQPDDPPLFTPEPRSPMQPIHWRWSDLLPLLERIGAKIDIGSGGQRRTLRLANPGLPWGTTPTFWGSIQYILPGEVAGAHRHSANAFRFIMEGNGASTTVDGERYTMNVGDLVLTPAWTFHDHIHHGDKPMIWLDVLDINIMRSMHATFFEALPTETQEVLDIEDRTYREYGSGLMRPPRISVGPAAKPTPPLNPLLVYERARAEASLDLAQGLPADPYDDVVLEYQNPVNGGPAMTTLSMKLQKLRPGFKGRARRHTGSKLYYVIRGSGVSVVGDQTFDWNTGDFIAVPPWAWVEHSNPSGAEALLFSVDDTPTLAALGYYREQGAPAT